MLIASLFTLSHIINYIITVDGFCVQVETNDTVAILKQKVEVREGISPDQQRLIFGGRQIEDDKTMSHYGIESGATVILVLRLCWLLCNDQKWCLEIGKLLGIQYFYVILYSYLINSCIFIQRIYFEHRKSGKVQCFCN